MKYLILGIIMSLPTWVASQENCNCIDELVFIMDYYERNLPAFSDNVTNVNRSSYDQFKDLLTNNAKQKLNKSTCFKLITRYVEFFKDNHSSVRMTFPRIDEQDADALRAFLSSEIYRSREKIELSNSAEQQYPLDDIRGVYLTADSTYIIAVIEDRSEFRDYVGVILASKTNLWEKGQVKLEIKRKENNEYEAFSYMRNHSLRYSPNFVFGNGRLGDVWFKSNLKEQVNYRLNDDFSFYIQELSDSIAYIRIPTFSGGYSAKIDSLYKASKELITSKKYLIIDVRNNGGGSDDNVFPLLEYIYTDPIQGDRVDLYVTKDNIKMWEKWEDGFKSDPENYGKADLKWIAREIKKMKKAPINTYIPRSKGRLLKHKPHKNAPKKVAIIQNRLCASSCETLLFWANESSKTILVGENSGGYVGYGEVGSVVTPCYGYNLYSTMTRYHYQRQFEVIGIAPDHRLSTDRDWVDQTIDLLTRRSE